MPLPVPWLLQLLQRWFGWEWAVLVVRREDDVGTLKLPEDLPVSIRTNTDGSVGMTIGHDDDGEALLADLRVADGQRRKRGRGFNPARGKESNVMKLSLAWDRPRSRFSLGGC